MGRRAVLTVALVVFRVIRALVFAAGLGWVVANVVAWPLAPDWLKALLNYTVALGAVFLAGSVAASALMPAMRTVLPPFQRPEDAPAFQGTVVTLVLALLAGAVLLQVPVILDWIAEDRALLREAQLDGPDPTGLNLVPAAMLLVMPAVASLALVTCLLASIVGAAIRRELLFKALAACVCLQAALVGGEWLMLSGMRAGAAQFRELISTTSNPAEGMVALDWLARHEVFGANVTFRLLLIFAGYVVALVLCELATREQRAQASPGTPAPSAAEAPPVTVPVIPPMPPRAVRTAASPSAAAFTASNYAVRLRANVLQLMVRHYAHYEIDSIPPMSRDRFSFSWRTGLLRREPDGPDLLALHSEPRESLLGRRPYSVSDAATGAPLAVLRRSGSDWEIARPSGQPSAQVNCEREGAMFASYVARVGGRDVCKYRWGTQGLTAFSAELEIEFLPDVDAFFDRPLLVALGPLLEEQARKAGENAHST